MTRRNLSRERSTIESLRRDDEDILLPPLSFDADERRGGRDSTDVRDFDQSNVLFNITAWTVRAIDDGPDSVSDTKSRAIVAGLLHAVDDPKGESSGAGDHSRDQCELFKCREVRHSRGYDVGACITQRWA